MGISQTGQAEDYWQKNRSSFEISGVEEVDYPCGKSLIACINILSRTIFIKKGLTKEMYVCALTHELKHAMGWSHDNRRQFVYDCGDGTIVMENNS